MLKSFCVAGTILVLALIGCAPAAPQVDVAADEAAIKKWFDDSTAALNASDGTILDFGTDDAVVMYENAPAVTGRDVLRAHQQGIYDQTAFKEIRTMDEFVVSGDWAFVRWSGKGTATPRDGGEPTEFDRKGIAILQRQPDNSWKFSRVIWNSNLLAPGGE